MGTHDRLGEPSGKWDGVGEFLQISKQDGSAAEFQESSTEVWVNAVTVAA